MNPPLRAEDVPGDRRSGVGVPGVVGRDPDSTDEVGCAQRRAHGDREGLLGYPAAAELLGDLLRCRRGGPAGQGDAGIQRADHLLVSWPFQRGIAGHSQRGCQCCTVQQFADDHGECASGQVAAGMRMGQRRDLRA